MYDHTRLLLTCLPSMPANCAMSSTKTTCTLKPKHTGWQYATSFQGAERSSSVSLLDQSGSSLLKPTLCSHQAVGMIPQHSDVVLAALACSTRGPHARPSISSLMHAPRCLEFVLKTMVDSFAGRACRALHSTQGPSGRRMPAPPPNYLAESGAAGLAAGMSVHKAAAVRAAASKYR